ncbi:MAG: hypothetical protein ACK5SI_10220, partial [Planctomycetia bacterium]
MADTWALALPRLRIAATLARTLLGFRDLMKVIGTAAAARLIAFSSGSPLTPPPLRYVNVPAERPCP